MSYLPRGAVTQHSQAKQNIGVTVSALSRQARSHKYSRLVCQKVLVCSSLVCSFGDVKNVVNDDVLSKLN